MANIIKRVWNQNRMVQIEDLRGMTFQAEAAGHTFQISGIDDDGNTVALTGTPSGVLLRPDNTDVALTCSVSGGVVSATLPANCYDVPGRFGLTIFITSGSSKTAIYAAVGTVTRTSSGTAAPGTTQSVVDLINAINTAVNSIPASYSALLADIAPTYSNSALYSVGQYAWYDGDLKRCIVPITTAESYTAAHWTSAVLGQDVSDLKSAFNADKDGYEFLEADWVIGLLDTTIGGSGAVNTAFTNRIATNQVLSFSRPIMFEIASGYRFAIALMNSSNVVTANKIVTGSGNIGYYTVPANQKFKLMVYKDSPVAVDSIDNYKKQLTFSTLQSEEYEQLKAFSIVNVAGENVFYSTFVRGSISVGTVVNRYDYRVVSADIMNYSTAIRVVAKTGFRFAVQSYNASMEYQSDSGFQTDYVIPANTNFRVCIARATETTSEIADIQTFVKNVTIENYATERAEKANNDIAMLSNNIIPINAEWQRGYVNNGEYSNISYVVRTKKCVKFDRDTLLQCNSQEFDFLLFEFSAETPSSSTYLSWYSGKLRGSYIVPANKYYVVCIERDPNDTSEIADVEEFVSMLNIIPNIVRKANEANDLWHLPAFGNGRKKYIAHKGLTNTYPENTTASFTDAGTHNVWGIETDIQVTSDGYLVCMHDDTVDRTTDGTGSVISKTLSQIRALHIDGDETGLLKVPTIEEYLGICKLYNCVAVMELKNMAANKTSLLALINTINKFGMQKQSIITCSQYSIGYVRTLTTAIPCMFNSNDSDYTTVLESAIKYPNLIMACDINTGTLLDAKITEIHSYNFPVCAYIVNSETTANDFIANGVDLIVTDWLKG